MLAHRDRLLETTGMAAAPKLKWTRHEDLRIERRPVIPRDEYLDFMTFRRKDRPLFTELFGPLIGLKEEWESQGASPAELDFSAFRYQCEDQYVLPVTSGPFGGPSPVVLEDTDTVLLSKDQLGRTMQLVKGSATLPLPLDYPVRDREDWERLKPLYLFREERLPLGWEQEALRRREAGQVICFAIPGGFDEPRQLMGEENLCLAYYEDPDLIHEILATIRETAGRVLERVASVLPVDVLLIHEDMAGKSGPLVGPEIVRVFLQPYYRELWDQASAAGARLFDQDSDGNISALLPVFLESGLNCIHPVEPVAGMNIVRLREIYGHRLAFRGGLDKWALQKGYAAIDAELAAKVPPMLATGGCVLSLDHRIPNGTPLEAYRYYMGKIWEYLLPAG